jgi:subtilisin-like proprotein convertase family protein
LILAGALGAAVVHGASLIVDATFLVNRAIPDGDSSGLVDRRLIPTAAGVPGAVRVNLAIAPGSDGGFNGDLYVTLSHGTDFAVLLNRPGHEADNPFGYDDGGINVTLGESAAGDIHSYRTVLGGSPDSAVPGGLTGQWQPDGRRTDPDAVSSLSLRTATLAGFHGADPGGEWLLFVSDLSPGGQSTLLSWGLEVVPVPESPASPAALVLLGGALAFAFRCRCRGCSPGLRRAGL